MFLRGKNRGFLRVFVIDYFLMTIDYFFFVVLGVSFDYAQDRLRGKW